MLYYQEEYYTAIQNCNNVGNIDLIKKNPSITQVEMAKALDLTRDGISYNIRVLKDKGIIERVGSTKNEIWKIKVAE